MIAYRSRAVVAPTEHDLDLIVRRAQERNRSLGLTGLLIYDQGCFFQWLEGPSLALSQVWDSISHDSRHYDLQILREQTIPRRFFGSWELRLARRIRGGIDPSLAVLRAPEQLLKQLRVEPSVLPRSAWDDIFADAVLPRLAAAHPPRHTQMSPARRRWHSKQGAAAELADRLLGAEGTAVAEHVARFVEQRAEPQAIYREVFEPAARHLGGLWYDDHLSFVDVTLGLHRLQVEVRRLGAQLDNPPYALRPGHTVLVATQPGEPHTLSAAMSSESFWRDGWHVHCDFPKNEQSLRQLVRNRWFDVLVLSLSCALRRDQRLKPMGAAIRAAQAASLNPALAVIVDGRTFFERPQAYLECGADAGCASVAETVPTAHRLLDALTAGRSRAQPVRPMAKRGKNALGSLRLFARQFRSTVF